MNLVSNFGSISPHHHCLNIYGTKGTGIYQLTNQFFISNKNKNKLFVVDNVKNNKELILKNYIKNLTSKKEYDKKKLVYQREELFDTTNICLKIDDSFKKKKWINT